MVIETERIENILVECIESSNEHQFQYILDELRINPNKKRQCFKGLSTFEKILMIPNSRKFIEICICNGCDFYKKNTDGIYPLRYAIDSFCADNLITILKPSEESFTPLCDDHFVATQYSMIVNEKLDGGNNYLHLLTNNITEENYAELSKMIMALVVNGCNVNYPNENLETPFYLLLKNPLVEFNLINFIIDNVKIDYYAHNSTDIVRMMEERGLAYRMTKQKDSVVDTSYMAQHLGDWNESQLIENLELWKKNAKDPNDEVMELLETAILKNLPETVGILMDLGAEINGISRKSKFKLTPGFLACTFGYHQVLKVLLTNTNLSFKSASLERNLLHQIFSSETIDLNDRQKIFDLVIADPRCTLDIINQVDGENRVPLVLACQYECNDIIKELLRRGAYIGYESVLNNIRKDTLEEFLNECVKCSSDINDRDCEIYIDYKFLMPPNKKTTEITSAHLISANPNLKEFILHPVIASFVQLKWRKIDFIIYFNLLLYFSFLIFLGYIIVNFYHVTTDFRHDETFCADVPVVHDDFFDDVKFNEFVFESESLSIDDSGASITQLLFENRDAIARFYTNKSLNQSELFDEWRDELDEGEWVTRFRQHFEDHFLSYWFGIFGLVLMTVYEVIQFAISYKKYFFEPINWLDMSLIILSFVVLLENFELGWNRFKQISAILILLMGAQCIQLCSKVSAFSLSLHMAILNKVCRTFLKTIAPYLIIISAFGMSFFALNYENDDLNDEDPQDPAVKGFTDPFLSTISTVRMMLSDFNLVNIGTNDIFQGILFLAFMISISVILFNLLNALAISDTNEMLKVAEFVETKKRISTLRGYETLFAFLKVKYANVFPKLTTIMLTPNKHSVIKVKQRVQMSDNVTILMQKTGKISNFEYLYVDWMLWKHRSEPLTFDEKLINKVLNFGRNQQEKELQDMDKIMNDQELYAIRVAQEEMYKELLKILNQQNPSEKSMKTFINESA